MKDIKEQATELWTRLVTAMRSDGLIAECITQSGPATTGVMIELVRGPGYEGTWLSPSIHPTTNEKVVGVDRLGNLLVMKWSENWNWHDAYSLNSVAPSKWTYIKLPE